MSSQRLVLILGDQLSKDISALKYAHKANDVVFFAEVAEEVTYVKHHKKKIAFIFSAMRHFADELRNDGWRVHYVSLDAPNNSDTLLCEVKRAIKCYQVSSVIVTEPCDWRLLSQIKLWFEKTHFPIQILPDTRFLASHCEFKTWASGRKQLRMEYFYRQMRKKTGLLMDGDKPIGGKWNFDIQNRKPAENSLSLPHLPRFEPDIITQDVLNLVARRFQNHFGDLKPFNFAVTRKCAEKALEHFITECLPLFGKYQDAMLSGQRFLYHSVLSHYINCGLLDPLETCCRVVDAYKAGQAPINSVEGFIRQIIGWREFVRGIYWLKMPEYKEQNFLATYRPLPDFYWTGETDMHCLREAIIQTKEEAYAHHIQRLMVTGNFAMLAGISTQKVHEWYLAVYADAYEWVELPNVIGMSQYADGGFLGSKPYAASGSYINKMSNYCNSCRYDVRKKTGAEACPFNALYWNFLIYNKDKLSSNARLSNSYATWGRMTDEKRTAYLDSAANFLETLS
ncbi:MAG: (6-4) photolyase [Hyphomicrobiaceae bacterium hypho_1]